MWETNKTYMLIDCDGVLQTEIVGSFQRLTYHGESVSCFVNSVADATTIAELVECCGYTFKSVVGKRVRITIEELKGDN